MIKNYIIAYYSKKVENDILKLPKTIQAKYLKFLDTMEEFGPNLGLPHTKSMGNGLFEMRIKSFEGLGRVFYCAKINKKIVVLHSFIKKTEKTPSKELAVAIKRMNEVKNG
jgi:phage-related protein